MKKTAFLLWFKDIDPEDAHLIGQKGADLAEMIHFGFSVPDGFCVTSSAYSEFLKRRMLIPKIKSLLGSLNFSDPRDLISYSREIKKLILHSRMPEKIARPIMEEYLEIEGLLNKSTVAVRSSPLNESLKATSFLNIRGEANVLENIKNCWASLFNPENLLKNRKILEEKMAVLIQRMLKPRVSGFVYPKNKTELAIKSSPSLNSEETDRVKKLAKKLRHYYFFPQKIEFAIQGKKIYILNIETLT